MSNTPATTTTPKEKKKVSPLAELHQRVSEIHFAIRLMDVYEFIQRPNDEVACHLYAPILDHTWVKPTFVEKFRGHGRPLVANKRLSAQARGDIPLPLGVTATLGKSGSGKTRLVYDRLFMTLALHDPAAVRYFRVFEPSDPARDERARDLLGAAIFDAIVREVDFDGDLALGLAGALVDPSVEVIIIDSLRYLFYSSTSGATGKGGVNMRLFMDLTHLDRVARMFGKRVVVVINPMTDDEAAFSFYIEAAVGAVSGVLITESARSGRLTNRYATSREFTAVSFGQSTVLDADAAKPATSNQGSGGGVATQPAVVNTSVFGRSNKS